MAAHEIEIIIEPGGIIKSEVHGIEGPSCNQLSKWIEMLGTLVTHKRTKDGGKTKKVVLNQKVKG